MLWQLAELNTHTVLASVYSQQSSEGLGKDFKMKDKVLEDYQITTCICVQSAV